MICLSFGVTVWGSIGPKLRTEKFAEDLNMLCYETGANVAYIFLVDTSIQQQTPLRYLTHGLSSRMNRLCLEESVATDAEVTPFSDTLLSDFPHLRRVLASKQSSLIKKGVQLGNYQALFKQDICEAHVFPLMTDLRVVEGCMILTRTNHITDVVRDKTESIVEIFLRNHCNAILSQCQDMYTVNLKIFFSHFQIIGASRFLLIPWSDTSLAIFDFLWNLSSMFSTFFSNNRCFMQQVCTMESQVYCKAAMLLTMPCIVLVTVYAFGALITALQSKCHITIDINHVHRFATSSMIIVLFYF